MSWTGHCNSSCTRAHRDVFGILEHSRYHIWIPINFRLRLEKAIQGRLIFSPGIPSCPHSRTFAMGNGMSGRRAE